MTTSSAREDLIITAEQLQALMSELPVKLVDASWYLPDQQRDGYSDYLERRLPGAVFFDIDTICDPASSLPHTLAPAAIFEEHVGKLGIAADDTIVVYDAVGVFTSARVAWNFRHMGAQQVRVLNGGLPAWLAVGGSLETGEPAAPLPQQFVAGPVIGRTVDRQSLAQHLEAGTALVLDVRPAERFSGRAKEPRPGVRSGHMPGAVNLPFPELLQDGELVSNDRLQKRLAAVGVSPDKLVVTSCGSGVTAAIALLALECIGHTHHALYDGSWSEWGAHPDTPVVTD